MIRIAILKGGTSSERDISLRSAQAVRSALVSAGYEVGEFDTAEHDIDSILADLQRYNVIFPVLHGSGGEDGSIQAWLEAHDLVYIGADSIASARCFDKWKYKQELLRLGIPTPNGELVTSESIWQSRLIRSPFVLKPNDGGSSVDTFIIRNPESADKAAITTALTKYTSMLLEELIVGTEITVGVLGDKALPVIEIIPPADGEFDYDNKYNGKSQELCPPDHVSDEEQKEAQDFARHIHHALKVRDMSRTDIMIRATDNKLFVLETNTIPGMTDQSLLPKAAGVAGYTMPDMVKTLVESALKRKSQKIS